MECLRQIGQSKIQLGKKADHFIFSVESSGCIPPQDIVKRAFDILPERCEMYLNQLNQEEEEEEEGKKSELMEEEEEEEI